MVFFDFEKPIENLYQQLDKLKQVGEEGKVDVSDSITNLEKKIKETKTEI